MKKPEKITPGPGQESVWDYPRPPIVEDVPKRIQIFFDGLSIADTVRGKRVLETAGAPVYYLPPADIRIDLLQRSGKRTFCEWKGWASYYDILVDNKQVRQAAWNYPNPTPGYEEITGFIAFYAQKMERCLIDGEIVRPQPGGFYGGWVTDNIVGPIKGEPGSEFW